MTIRNLIEELEYLAEEQGDETMIVINDGGMGYVHRIECGYEPISIRAFWGDDVSKAVQLICGTQIGMSSDEYEEE